MAHGTYNNPRAGSTASALRMQEMVNKVNGNSDDKKEHRKKVRGYKKEIRRDKSKVAQIVNEAGHENKNYSEDSIYGEVFKSGVAQRAYNKNTRKAKRDFMAGMRSSKDSWSDPVEQGGYGTEGKSKYKEFKKEMKQEYKDQIKKRRKK